MAIRADASGEYLSRTSGVPVKTAFTACGWATMRVDRNTYSTIFTASSSGSADGIVLQTEIDGTSLVLYWWNSGWLGGTIIVTLAADTPFFWAVVGSASAIRAVHITPSGTLTGYNSSSQTSITLAEMHLLNIPTAGEWFNGSVQNVIVYDRALSDDELRQQMFSHLPVSTTNIHAWWPLLAHSDLVDYSGNGRNLTATGTLSTEAGAPIAWRRGSSRIWIPVSAGGGGIEGQAALTQDAQTLSSAGTVSIAGSASITQAAQTVSAAGTIPISGEAALQQAEQGISAVGAMPLEGAASLTQSPQSVTAVGIMPLSGAADIAQAAQTVSGQGDVAVSGEAAISQSPHNLSATGDVAISGEAVLSQDANTVSASSGDNQGSLDIVQDAQTASATGAVAISGSVDIAQAGQAVIAAGLMPISGNADLTQSAQAIISSGAVGNSGTADISQAGQTVSAAGVIAIQGSANIAQAVQTMIATGFITRLVDAPHTSIHIRPSAFTIVGGFGSGSGPGMGQSGFLQGVGIYQ